MGSAGKALLTPITGIFTPDLRKGLEPDIPKAPKLPPPVEEIDIRAKKEQMVDAAKRRKGRRSTILASLGNSNAGKKTVLG